jgi:hypothetical protein
MAKQPYKATRPQLQSPDDSSQPPDDSPQPPSHSGPPSTRPSLDLPHVIDQVNGIQTFLSQERERDEARKRAWDKANVLLRGESKEESK